MIVLTLILIALAAVAVFHTVKLLKILIHWIIVMPYLMFFGTEKQINRAYEKHVLKGSEEEKEFNKSLEDLINENEIVSSSSSKQSDTNSTRSY